MQKRVNNISRFKSMTSGMLLAIFALYFVNISLFSHYHVVDGVTIVHSHFHNNEHTKDHNDAAAHTKSELTLIQAISNYVVESPSAPFTLDDAYSEVEHTYIINDEHIELVNNVVYPPLRGPPAALLIG